MQKDAWLESNRHLEIYIKVDNPPFSSFSSEKSEIGGEFCYQNVKILLLVDKEYPAFYTPYSQSVFSLHLFFFFCGNICSRFWGIFSFCSPSFFHFIAFGLPSPLIPEVRSLFAAGVIISGQVWSSLDSLAYAVANRAGVAVVAARSLFCGSC